MGRSGYHPFSVQARPGLFQKGPQPPERDVRAASKACLYSLSVTTTEDAAAELSRLNQVVKQPSAKKLVGKSLDKAAELSGQTREDLEESTVPTYGLDAEGRVKLTLGDFTAEFCIQGPDAFQLIWRKADGKTQKTVPAEVRETNHAAGLKPLLNARCKMSNGCYRPSVSVSNVFCSRPASGIMKNGRPVI